MRMSLRLILSLIVGISVVTALFSFYQARAAKQALRSDLERRAEVLAQSLSETVEPYLQGKAARNLPRMVERFGNRQRLVGIAVYDAQGTPLAITSGLQTRLAVAPTVIGEVVARKQGQGEFSSLGSVPMHIRAQPLFRDDVVVGALAIFHDASYIDAQSYEIWRVTLLRVLTQTIFIVLATLLIVRWSIAGPIARTAHWMRDLRTGKLSKRPNLPATDLIEPLMEEVTHFTRSLAAARAAAETEARLRETAETLWTPERLHVHVRNKLGGRPLFVVSNREPYMHVRRGKSVDAITPAGGLVTALHPILCACDGTWIAHGAGDADRETVDARDRLRVTTENPQYTLRRVWLTKEEEEGYYFGFANEGLWPLCHIAHTRPTFRVSDWEQYQAANRKFAAAVAEETAGVKHPFVLIQDYHFALLPRMVKELRPDAHVAIFWHIPWPNPQAFDICPWQRQLLDGLLGADLIGFQIQAHCNHFLESVDQALESRIEWDRFTVHRHGHLTAVRPFPISVAVSEKQPETKAASSPYLDRAALLREHGVQASFMGVGVDRIDYTKGIPERLRGIERFFERYPAYQSQFTFVELGAPSRTHIKRYHDLLAEVEAEAERINWRFATRTWKPIIFLERHHNRQEINQYYRAADICLVTSLHDGMNLVAKEYIATHEDDQGALILSRFAGARRELHDALIVNPYDTEQLADAIRLALEMDPEERKARMERMKKIVTEQNVYRWAGNLITALSEVRPETAAKVKAATV